MRRNVLIPLAALLAMPVSTFGCGKSPAEEVLEIHEKVRGDVQFEVKKEKRAKKVELSGKRSFGKEDERTTEKAARTTNISKRESDRKIAMAALAALGLKGPQGAVSNVFGPGGLDSGINNALGGLRAVSTGDAAGAGALGARGLGIGGGGNSLGIGGLRAMRRGGVDLGGRGKSMRRIRLASGAGKAAPAEVFHPAPAPSKGGTFVHAGTNPFVHTLEDKLSTFAIDVDTASYTYARRFLQVGNVPPPSSVRVEEWINAFHYDYAGPDGHVPFAAHMEAGPSPFHEGRHLVRVGIQGKRLTNAERNPVHLTFLVDVSGSMRTSDKLPLAKSSLATLVNNLRRDDSVAIVTYAGRTAEILPTTKVRNKQRILIAINNMESGGGTNMGSAMEMAYRNANKHLGDGRMARVVVLSDGDANIGRTSHQDILQAVKGYVSEGVTLSTIGFGTGNYRDHLMEQLADAGNGNYSYIDSPAAAQRVFGEDLVGTLQVIAQDVKIQVEFNPKSVARYRLLGYENRDIADKDFRNDKVDAGEIGAGHSVTALYEIELTKKARPADIATVRVRYKQPRGTSASEVTHSLTAAHMKSSFNALSADTRFATALAVAAEVLRGSPYAEGLSLANAGALASKARTGNYAAERSAFVKLMRRGSKLAQRSIR